PGCSRSGLWASLPGGRPGLAGAGTHGGTGVRLPAGLGDRAALPPGLASVRGQDRGDPGSLLAVTVILVLLLWPHRHRWPLRPAPGPELSAPSRDVRPTCGARNRPAPCPCGRKGPMEPG